MRALELMAIRGQDELLAHPVLYKLIGTEMVRDSTAINKTNDPHSSDIILSLIDVDTRFGKFENSYRFCFIGFDTARSAQVRELSRNSHCSLFGFIRSLCRKTYMSMWWLLFHCFIFSNHNGGQRDRGGPPHLHPLGVGGVRSPSVSPAEVARECRSTQSSHRQQLSFWWALPGRTRSRADRLSRQCVIIDVGFLVDHDFSRGRPEFILQSTWSVMAPGCII